ncbi:hypothetical protein [Nocardia gipuzkoensis]
MIQSEMGPQDDDEVAERFRAHVYLMRNSIWEAFIAPLATKLVERSQRRPAELGEKVPYPGTSPKGFVATLKVWAWSEVPNLPYRPQNTTIRNTGEGESVVGFDRQLTTQEPQVVPVPILKCPAGGTNL